MDHNSKGQLIVEEGYREHDPQERRPIIQHSPSPRSAIHRYSVDEVAEGVGSFFSIRWYEESKRNVGVASCVLVYSRSGHAMLTSF